MTAELLVDVAGAFLSDGRGTRECNEPPIGADWAARIAPAYFGSRAASIYSGSSEIQTNIIVKAVLGLFEGR